MGIYNLIFRNAQDADEFYETYLEAYQKDVYLIILRYVKEHQTAEDLMQETMYTAMRKVHQLRDPKKSRAWLLKIARNKALYYLRRKRQFPKTISLEESSEELLEPLPSVLDQLISECDAEILRNAFCQLDEETSVIIWLHADRGDTFAQIAEIMDMHPKAVASRYYRGRNKIVAYIEKENRWKEK